MWCISVSIHLRIHACAILVCTHFYFNSDMHRFSVLSSATTPSAFRSSARPPLTTFSPPSLPGRRKRSPIFRLRCADSNHVVHSPMQTLSVYWLTKREAALLICSVPSKLFLTTLSWLGAFCMQPITIATYAVRARRARACSSAIRLSCGKSAQAFFFRHLNSGDWYKAYARDNTFRFELFSLC